MTTENKKIYIVDDDRITIFGVRKILSRVVNEDTIESFENGKLALDQILIQLENKADIPDVIFLDINMPVMDGWQFLEAFNKLKIEKRVKVKIITSSIDPLDYERWLYYQKKSSHSIDFWNKPIHEISLEDISFIGKAS